MDIHLPPLLKHQAEFLRDTDTRYLALVGGYGSRKTTSLALKLIWLAALNADVPSKGIKRAVLAPTYKMAMGVIVPALQKFLYELQVTHSYSKSTNTFVIRFGKRCVELLVFSAENYDRIAGHEFAFFGVDEADLIRSNAEDAWRMLHSRLRKGRCRQGVAVSTPEGFRFMYEFFVKQPAEDDDLHDERRLIKASTFDNPFLPKDYAQSILKEYPEAMAKAYLYGEFVNLQSGQVYYCFDRRLNHTDSTIDDYPSHVLHVRVDFNVTNCTAMVAVIDKRCPTFIDELTGIYNTEAICEQLKDRYGNRPIIIYPDASGKNSHSNSTLTDHKILKDAGFDVKYRSKNPRVMDRVGSVNALLRNGKRERRMKVNTKVCKHLTETLEQQAFDPNGAPDKKRGLDHAADAMGYLVWFNWPIVGTGKLYQY